MSHLKKIVFTLATFVIIGLTANPALAQVQNPSFETGNFSGYSFPNITQGETPPCARVVTSLPGLVPTNGQFFAVLHTTFIRQCEVTTGGSLETIAVPNNAPPGTHLLVDLDFLTNELNSAQRYNDLASVFLTVEAVPSPQIGNVRYSQPVLVAFFSRDQLQPGGAGSPLPGTFTNVGGFALSTGWRTYAVDVSPYAGKLVYLTFNVRNAADLVLSGALTIDNIRLSNLVTGTPLAVPLLEPADVPVPVRSEPQDRP